MTELRGLYAISDERLTPDALLPQQAEEALAGGARFLQLRHKTGSDETLLPLSKTLKTLCDRYNALLIINDRIALARACNAHGVHLGREDGALNEARQQLGRNCIIGISCYGDLERAKRMQENGADYVAFGSFFPSPTKPQAATVALSILSEAKKQLHIPLCAIGGITATRASSLIDAGADMLAVISDLWQNPPKRQAALYAEYFKKETP